MHTRNLFKSRKAISPILATLLLIVIAVAAIVVTYAWIMTYMGSTTSQAGVLLYKAQVNFVTEGSTKRIYIDIGNSGTSDTGILRVYCGSAVGNLPEQTPIQSLPIPLPHESIARITINYDWTAGTTYYFKVFSTSGQRLGDPDPWADQAPAS
jgi:flagellin-like protein